MAIIIFYNSKIDRILTFCQNVHFPYTTTVTKNIFHPNQPQKHTCISYSNPRNPLIYRTFLSINNTHSVCGEMTLLLHLLRFVLTRLFYAITSHSRVEKMDIIKTSLKHEKSYAGLNMHIVLRLFKMVFISSLKNLCDNQMVNTFPYLYLLMEYLHKTF